MHAVRVHSTHHGPSGDLLLLFAGCCALVPRVFLGVWHQQGPRCPQVAHAEKRWRERKRVCGGGGDMCGFAQVVLSQSSDLGARHGSSTGDRRWKPTLVLCVHYMRMHHHQVMPSNVRLMRGCYVVVYPHYTLSWALLALLLAV